MMSDSQRNIEHDNANDEVEIVIKSLPDTSSSIEKISNILPIVKNWKNVAKRKKEGKEKKVVTENANNKGTSRNNKNINLNKLIRNNKFYTRRDQRRFSLISNDFMPKRSWKGIYSIKIRYLVVFDPS